MGNRGRGSWSKVGVGELGQGWGRELESGLGGCRGSWGQVEIGSQDQVGGGRSWGQVWGRRNQSQVWAGGVGVRLRMGSQGQVGEAVEAGELRLDWGRGVSTRLEWGSWDWDGESGPG